jgi:hypothetical protein
MSECLNRKRIFQVNTNHTDYDETNPFIVLADSEEEAKQIVENDSTYKSEAKTNLQYTYKPASKIVSIEEISMDKSIVLWGQFNAG